MHTAEDVREIIATMERDTKSLSARASMARLAVRRAKCDEAGRLVWKKYLWDLTKESTK